MIPFSSPHLTNKSTVFAEYHFRIRAIGFLHEDSASLDTSGSDDMLSRRCHSERNAEKDIIFFLFDAQQCISFTMKLISIVTTACLLLAMAATTPIVVNGEKIIVGCQMIIPSFTMMLRLLLFDDVCVRQPNILHTSLSSSV